MKIRDWFNHKNEIINDIKEMKSNPDYETTYIYALHNDGKSTWALVFGWRDGEEYGDDINRLNGYLGYVPNNSLMHEYGYDWIMPYNEEYEEVDDTEITIETPIQDLLWFEKEWKRMKKDYKLTA